MGDQLIKPGDKFAYFTVIELRRRNGRGESWVCRCVCGKEMVIGRSILLGKKQRKSCGCKEYPQGGLSKKYKKLYDVWFGMLKRCYNEEAQNAEYYIEKGIKVCPEWKDSFPTFWEWAMNNGYKEGLTIDRIDSDKDYDPDNCRWVDWYTQSHNKGMLKNNTTGVTGVYKKEYGYFVVMTRNRKKYYLGHYKDFEVAKEVRANAEKYYREHGTLEGYMERE